MKRLPVSLQITDFSGRVLFRQKYTAGNNQLQLPIQKLPPGLYQLQINSLKGNLLWGTHHGGHGVHGGGVFHF